jgi:hypothetical protein
MLPKFFEKIPFYVKLRDCLFTHYIDFLKRYIPSIYANYLYQQTFGYKINWEKPQDLNEVINYLSFKTDTTIWTKLADKYKVRDYLKEKGLENILIPLLGHWKSVDDIDFDSLPNSFVIKCNNGSGDAIIIQDKKQINFKDIKNSLKQSLNRKFGLENAEPHYLKIPPCIIAEQNIVTTKEPLIDYKIWCFNGKPFCIFTVSNRNIKTHTADYNLYSLEWDDLSQSYLAEPYKNNIYVKRPPHLAEMLHYAQILSKGFPQVRVDFYDISKKVYFGEMTFTSQCGRMDYFTPEFLKIMGTQISMGSSRTKH